MKKTVNISIENEKLTALEMYLNQKNTKLSDELLKYTEQLYQKNVPSNVRDFIELAASKKGNGREKKKEKKSGNDADRNFLHNTDNTAVEP